MSRRGNRASIVASPVLVGAVTVLVAIVAVFLAYNANQGLPFVPTYDVKAEIPSGAKLVPGNEVRAGGFRIGLVEEVSPKTVEINGRRRSVAVIDMKLEKDVEPLKADTAVRVRPRSALGLKFVEITPGTRGKELAAGDTIALENASEPLDLEDVLATFDPPTRRSVRSATVGFGNAFAGRGASLNTAIEALNPFFRDLVPVMSNLAESDTELDRFFVELGESAAQVAPVAEVQARLFAKMADTFAAFVESPAALQETIEKSPPTLEASIESFRVTRPFLSDFADLASRLRPAAQELPRSLPPLNSALAVGTPVLPRTADLSDRLGDSFTALGDLMERPATLLALRDLREGLAVSRPALEFIAPYQTVCNHFIYFIHSLGELAVAGPGGADRWRNGPQPEHQVRQLRAAEQPRLDLVLAAMGRAAERGPADGHQRGGQPRPRLQPAVQPRDRRPGQRRLSGRPDGLHQGAVDHGWPLHGRRAVRRDADRRQLVRHRQRPAGPARRHLQVA